MQYVTVRCSVWQQKYLHIAGLLRLQCITVCCSVVVRSSANVRMELDCYNCSVLQCVAAKTSAYDWTATIAKMSAYNWMD
jgi:hypothetical protein